MRRLCMAGALASLLLAAGSMVAQESSRVLLAHLPSSPVENAGRQASAITDLTAHLSGALGGSGLEAKIFRRAQDAATFLDAEGSRVALVLSEAPFVLDYAERSTLRPIFRVLRAGAPTRRRLLVVKSEARIESLPDLEGKSLSYVESAVASDVPFLERRVFSGHLDLSTWFGQLVPESTDFSATAAVLYGKTDAAFVAEDNPLLARHLGEELRVVFESPPLSLPLLSSGPSGLEEAELRKLGEALAELGGGGIGGDVVAALGWDGFESLSAAERRAAARLPAPEGKRLEIAFPAGELELEPPALPAPAALPFVVAIELPDLPLDPDRILELEPAGSSEPPGNR